MKELFYAGYLLVWWLCGFIGIRIAKNKGRDTKGWWWMGFNFGLFLLIYSLFIHKIPIVKHGKKDYLKKYEESNLTPISITSDVKECPNCRDAIKLGANRCGSCGYIFPRVGFDWDDQSLKVKVKRKQAEIAPIWRTRPLFITSTFRDMHAERDYLHHHVFPVLEERLRARFHHLAPIDLRWGVETLSLSEQHEKEMLVLKVCLAEIDRSRPFLIGILGDRYGWVPPAERLVTAIQEVGYDMEVAGKSVTALEIEYGVLKTKEQIQRSRFYFRQPLPYEEMSPEIAALYSDAYSPEATVRESHARLVELKNHLQATLPDRCRS
jgi:hypothetical protein